MASQFYYLTQLLQTVFPVKLEIDVEPVVYLWSELNGQEVMIAKPYDGQVEWEEVVHSCMIENRFCFKSPEGEANIKFYLKKVSGIEVSKFLYLLADTHAKAVHELHALNEENCSFNDLYSLQQLIDERRKTHLVSEYSIDGVSYKVEFQEEVLNQIPFHLQLGADGVPLLVAKYLVSPFFDSEHSKILEVIDDIYNRIKAKMLEIPNVRVTEFRKLVWQDKLKHFDSIEKALIDVGRLLPDCTINLNKMSKKESALYLFLLGDYGFLGKKNHKESPQAYRTRVRKAFEQHYNLTSLADQFKPSDYPSGGVNRILLDIPIELLGDKIDKNPVLE